MGIDFNKVLINLDTYTSYVPVLSTVTNLVDLMLKAIFRRERSSPPFVSPPHPEQEGPRLCSFAGYQLLEISLSPRSIAQRKESKPFQKRSKSLQRHRKRMQSHNFSSENLYLFLRHALNRKPTLIEDQKKAYQEAAEIWENLAKVQTDKTMRSYYEGNRLLNLGKCYFISGKLHRSS